MSLSKFSFWNADGNFDWYYENCCLKLLLFESQARASRMRSSSTQSVCDLLRKKKKERKKAWRRVSLFVPCFYNYGIRKWSLFTGLSKFTTWKTRLVFSFAASLPGHVVISSLENPRIDRGTRELLPVSSSVILIMESFLNWLTCSLKGIWVHV